METRTIQHWWNGTWGRLARRDIYLRSQTVWRVELRQGGAEGRTKEWTFDSEAQARELIDQAIAAGQSGVWRQVPT